jgi:hypothetical protein
MKAHKGLECALKTKEAIARRILHAVVKADNKLVSRLDGASIFDIAYRCCLVWSVDRQRRKAYKRWVQQRRRIVRAACALQKDLQSPEDIEWAKRLERRNTPAPLSRRPDDVKWNSRLVRLVGRLAQVFEQAFQVRAGYTTDPDTNETDSPFIRFVEQVFREFRVTRDGNQPYQRRSIANALNEFRKQTET